MNNPPFASFHIIPSASRHEANGTKEANDQHKLTAGGHRRTGCHARY
jgi:hypothetical protein